MVGALICQYCVHAIELVVSSRLIVWRLSSILLKCPIWIVYMCCVHPNAKVGLRSGLFGNE